MSTDEPSAEVKLDHVADAIAGLHAFFVATEPLERGLRRIAADAAGIIPDVDAVTITVLTTTDQPRTAAFTDDRYLDIHEQQYAAGRGPCLDAARSQQPVRATTGEHRDWWPEFAQAAEQAGVRAYLSVPLVLTWVEREPELVGSFNIYSYQTGGFDGP